ncbi:hypothetical protein KXD40_005936 [Peronospora effusa]|uniref:Uncharacterized protein n=1 Tax=Peronospora effusa TaxID=542832 RepID=A0A425C0X9_9STRA|nr:hypothetical protein DD237_008519 [Peronospora effusa]UIZ25784.1 hypothetical protein KXD40_005936 [Peronospora effusa]
MNPVIEYVEKFPHEADAIELKIQVSAFTRDNLRAVCRRLMPSIPDGTDTKEGFCFHFNLVLENVKSTDVKTFLYASYFPKTFPEPKKRGVDASPAALREFSLHEILLSAGSARLQIYKQSRARQQVHALSRRTRLRRSTRGQSRIIICRTECAATIISE